MSKSANKTEVGQVTGCENLFFYCAGWGGILWHLQKFLQCIKYINPFTALLYYLSPPREFSVLKELKISNK
jgi:hypothetical protein